MKKILNLILIISALFLGFYIGNFHNTSFSTKPTDWGSFGSFLSPFTNLLMFAAVFLTLSHQDRISKREMTIKKIEHMKILKESAFETVHELYEYAKKSESEVNSLKKEIEQYRLSKLPKIFSDLYEMQNIADIYIKEEYIRNYFIYYVRQFHLFALKSTDTIRTQKKFVDTSNTYTTISILHTQLSEIINYIIVYYLHKEKRKLTFTIIKENDYNKFNKNINDIFKEYHASHEK